MHPECKAIPKLLSQTKHVTALPSAWDNKTPMQQGAWLHVLDRTNQPGTGRAEHPVDQTD